MQFSPKQHVETERLETKFRGVPESGATLLDGAFQVLNKPSSGKQHRMPPPQIELFSILAEIRGWSTGFDFILVAVIVVGTILCFGVCNLRAGQSGGLSPSDAPEDVLQAIAKPTNHRRWKDTATSAPSAATVARSSAKPGIPDRPPTPPPSPGPLPQEAVPKPRSSFTPQEDGHLCPDLVVPEKQECTLLIPRILTAGRRMGEVSVADIRGSSVFRAKWEEGDAGKKISLISASQETFVFGCCGQTASSSRPGVPPTMIIQYADGRQFGSLGADATEAGSSYVVSTPRGRLWKFKGDAHLGNLNAMDGQSRLLAIAEPDFRGERCVRIGPQVDVGLMILSMMAIDLLESKA